MIGRRKERHGYRGNSGDRGDPGPSDNPGSVDPATDLAAATEDGPSEGPPGLEPIRAFKRTNVVERDGSWFFYGYGGTTYGVEAEARCAGGYSERKYVGSGRSKERKQHGTVPERDCSCGFYALEDPLKTYGGPVLLEVELFGRVILGDRGYRGEKMRVLSARWVEAPQCSAELVTDPDSNGMRRPYTCPARGDFTIGNRHVCAEHALAQRRKFQEFAPDLDALSRDLPTEWRAA